MLTLKKLARKELTERNRRTTNVRRPYAVHVFDLFHRMLNYCSAWDMGQLGDNLWDIGLGTIHAYWNKPITDISVEDISI